VLVGHWDEAEVSSFLSGVTMISQVLSCAAALFGDRWSEVCELRT
jgi:hypothetical protein